MTQWIQLVLKSLTVAMVMMQASVCLAQDDSGAAAQKESPEAIEKRRLELVELGESLRGEPLILTVPLFIGGKSALSNEDLRTAIELATPDAKKDDFEYLCLVATFQDDSQQVVSVTEKHLESNPKSIVANALRYVLMDIELQGESDLKLQWKSTEAYARSSLIDAFAEKDPNSDPYTVDALLGRLMGNVIKNPSHPEYKIRPNSWYKYADAPQVQDRGELEVIKAAIASRNNEPNGLVHRFHLRFLSFRNRATESPLQTANAIDLSELLLRQVLVGTPQATELQQIQKEWGNFQVYKPVLSMLLDDFVATDQVPRGIKLLDDIESKKQSDDGLAQDQASLIFPNRILLTKHSSPAAATQIALARIDACLEGFEKDKEQFVALMEAFEYSFLAVDVKGFTKVFEKFSGCGFIDASKEQLARPLSGNDENKLAYAKTIDACFSRFVSANVQPRFFRSLEKLSELDGWTIQDAGDPRPLLGDSDEARRMIATLRFDLALAQFAKHAHSRTLLNEMHLETENWLNRWPKSAQFLEDEVVVLLLQTSKTKIPIMLRGQLEKLSKREGVFFSALEKGDRNKWRPIGKNKETKNKYRHNLPKIRVYNNTLSCELLDLLKESGTHNYDAAYRILVFDKSGELKRLLSPGFERYETLETTIDALLRD